MKFATLRSRIVAISKLRVSLLRLTNMKSVDQKSFRCKKLMPR